MKEEKLQIHANGVEYSTYTINHKEEENSKDVEYKLFHTIVNKRLDGENFAEYQNRKIYINKFKKDIKKGRMIWFSKNLDTIQNLKLSNMLLGLKAENGKGEEELKEALMKLKQTEELAYKTNLGTYNKKKVEDFIASQQEEEQRKIYTAKARQVKNNT